MSKKQGNGFIWYFVLPLALLAIAKYIDSPTPTVDIYKVNSQAMPKIKAAIEKEDSRREAKNEKPMTEEEIQSISESITLNEIKKQKSR